MSDIAGWKTRRFWRSVGGKKAWAYSMFANENRKKKLKTQGRLWGTLTGISLLATGLLAAWSAVMLLVWLLGIVFVGLGPLIAKQNYGLDFNGYTEKLFGGSLNVLQWAVWAALAFAVFYVIKFIMEWFIILAESRDLKKDPEKNANHIAIATAVKRTRISALVFSITMCIVIFVAANFVDQGEQINTTLLWILAIAFLVVFAFNKIFHHVQVSKVANNIYAVQQQLKEVQLNNNPINNPPQQ